MVRDGGAANDFSSVRTGVELGGALQTLFAAHGGSITRAGLAKRLGVRITTVANWFSGSVPRDRDKFRILLMDLQAYDSEARQLLVARDRLYDQRQIASRRQWDDPDEDGAPLTPPLGALPTVHGRDELLDTLADQLTGGGLVVLAGLGGVGKTTLALALAQRQRDARAPVWWVPANDQASLAAAMTTLALRLGARKAELTSNAAVMKVCWRLLDHQPRPWLLCIDNADVPEVLAPRGTSLPAGTGWIRTSRSGTVVVSTRLADPATWGRRAHVHEVAPVDVAAGARILLDLVPGDDREVRRQAGNAEALSERLGNLPLALYLAGSYLRTGVAAETMADLVDLADRGVAVPVLDRAAVHALGVTDERGQLGATWRLSLDALERHGVRSAAAVLAVLARFAPNVPLPVKVLRPTALAEHHAPGLDDDSLFAALVGLRRFGLITAPGNGTVAVHPLLAQVVVATSGSEATRAAAATLAAAAHEKANVLDPVESREWLSLASHLRALLDHIDFTDTAATELAASAAETVITVLVDRQADLDIAADLAAHVIAALSPTTQRVPVCKC